jgi:hypothetical protein
MTHGDEAGRGAARGTGRLDAPGDDGRRRRR